VAGREKRKRRRGQRPRREAAGADAAATIAPPEKTQPKPKSKDDIAREELVPLEEGERPLAVTISAVIAALLGLSNLVGLVAGVKVGGESFPVSAVLPQVVVMLVAAVGMWYARYWAVLGFQVILGFLIVFMSLLLVRAENVLAVAIATAILAGAGTLFWFLVQSLARIQMPSRDMRRPR
jgi:hypothetical protein